VPSASRPEALEALPFAAGERLEYRARVARFGEIGRAVLWVEGPVELRGQQALRLRFDIDTRVGLVRVVDRHESWLDPERMTALRYHKHERHPLARRDERVELFPGARRWERADGVHGASETDVPLDELSFLYFVRTLPLDADTACAWRGTSTPSATRPRCASWGARRSRRRRASSARWSSRCACATSAATGAGGEGVLRLHLSDDARRLPCASRARPDRRARRADARRLHERPARAPAPLLAGAP
jgi:hypothetical protein